MSADVIQFVDSIDASPTVLLDVNLDLNPWICRLITANPPRLRRAMSSNAMRDGVFVSSSQYEARTVLLDLEVLDTTQDLGAAQLQALARVLDRDDVFLKWQPNGASKPVFFKLYRSDISAIRDIQVSSRAYRAVQVELLAEPFALGLMETITEAGLRQNPTLTNGCVLDVTGVLGDVPAPCIIEVDAAASTDYWAQGMIGVRQHGTPSDLGFFVQAESCTLGTNTTNPGGGPDAAMSGAGANNFVRTSFATASMVTRLTVVPPDALVSTAAGVAIRGTFRLIAAVRRSDDTSVITVRAGQNSIYQPTATIPLTTTRQYVDLGAVSFGTNPRLGYDAEGPIDILSWCSVSIQAERVSGAGTLDWDVFYLVPADEACVTWGTPDIVVGTGKLYLDGINDAIRFIDGTTEAGRGVGFAGSLPSLVPNQTNRFVVLVTEINWSLADVTFGSASDVISFHYWPRYLYVRPSAS